MKMGTGNHMTEVKSWIYPFFWHRLAGTFGYLALRAELTEYIMI